MDTGTHVICNLVVQGKRPLPKARLFALIIAGAVLPDLPIIAFYFWESVIQGTPEHVIWTERYFLPHWQDFIDFFNSIPILAVTLGVAFLFRLRWLQIVAISMLMHVALDLPVHHDDAHRHLFPLLDWKFVSPVSYWDPKYYGDIVARIQLGFVICALIWLWTRHKDRVGRVTVVALAVVQAAFVAFASIVW